MGDPSSVDAIRPALRDLRVVLTPLSEPEAVADEGDWVGIVLAGLEARPRVADRVAKLRRLSPAPVFAVVPDDLSGPTTRGIYQAGASGVFSWPREALLLDRFLAEMLALRLARGRAKGPDVALARTVRTHIKLIPGLHTVPRVRAGDGRVHLSGSVDSLSLKREIERTVAGVPGVRSLDVEDLHVIPAAVPDARIRRAARRLLETGRGGDSGTISVSVDAGQLVLSGSSASRRELRRLEELAAGIRGVRSVELRILLSPQRHREDRNAARRLRATIAEFFPDERVELTYFSGVAVLAGATGSLRARRAIVEFVADDRAVSRVVDKLEVRS